MLTWATSGGNAAVPYIDLQIEGSGDGWIAAGFVGASQKMVARPSHKVVVMDGGQGQASMYELNGYSSTDLAQASLKAYGVSTTVMQVRRRRQWYVCGGLRDATQRMDDDRAPAATPSHSAACMATQSASGQMVLRFRQFLNASAVPLSTSGTAHVLWASSSSQPFPSKHDHEGYATLHLDSGTCTLPSESSNVPGFVVLTLPLLGAILARTPMHATNLGRFLLQRRLAAISVLPSWARCLTCYTLASFQNLKWGEVRRLIQTQATGPCWRRGYIGLYGSTPLATMCRLGRLSC